MAELDFVSIDDRPSHVVQKEEREEASVEWDKLDKLNYQNSPHCHRCLFWDSKKYSIKNREDYCKMILISEEDAMNPKLLPDGNRVKLSIGKNFNWICK